MSLAQNRSLVWSVRSRQWRNTCLIFLLLANETWIWKDFTQRSTGVECQLLAIGPKCSVFKEPHEDLEQSFCAEIAIVVKHLKTVKETKGNKRIMQTAERVEKSENEESRVGKV